MAQYPIPQFIESEGKIIYFLTFRQFFLLLLGGGICFILFFTLPFFLFVMGAMLTMGIIIGIAFLKIDNTPFLTFVMNFVTYTTKAKNYTWRKKQKAYPMKMKTQMPKMAPSEPENPVKAASAARPSAPLKTGTSSLSAAKKIIDTKK